MHRMHLICGAFVFGVGLHCTASAAEIDVACTEQSIARHGQAAMRAIIEGRGTAEDARVLKKIMACYQP
ncbi:hypothetical protein [Paludibacterium purpuratum]|uniref:Uncharacterized protein n=1 Tax=Paludibacterium purpuratum TaxID=1144873 RepID=A0A4R7B177_9NEIS|nr:hypothetical protein [Paludibacterium purpuratum]TDR73076.1 hypothetical protein DFP86_115108 [Paludibacterium purpuratum]